MRICLVFDCLYPYTVGGGERWYRALAEGLASRGLGVTYLTRLQWDSDAGADVPGVDVVAVAPAMELYADGRRSISVQLRFALGVFRHLVAHGGRYDVVQTPALHVSLLAVLAARPFRRFRIVVDWFEVWTREYWLEYLGGLAGRLGWLAQRLTARSRHEALCFSRLHAERLERLGHRGRITIVEGLAVLPDEDPAPAPATPLVVFAGRHIPEKNAPAVVAAVARAQAEIPELRGEIFGDGPDREEVLRLIEASDLDGTITAPGFAEADQSEIRCDAPCATSFRRAARGTASSSSRQRLSGHRPSSSTAPTTPRGSSWWTARTASSRRSAEPDELAQAIVRVNAAGPALRESTAAWFRRNRSRLSIDSTLEKLADVYRR